VVRRARLDHGPGIVPSSVAQVLGVRERSGFDLTETLANHLKSRRLLLVLDNCEHLIDACATLATALLLGAPEIRIVASSREQLQIAGEQIYPVPPLSLPTPGAASSRLRARKRRRCSSSASDCRTLDSG
jgi:non-specific serine/threonine protein kinase